MSDQLETRRIGFYLLIAFGYSWTIALIIYLTGGLTDSLPLVEGSPITWAFVLLVLYMFGPTLGNIGARLLTKEGAQNLYLGPKLKQGWKYWLLVWVLTPVFVLAGAAFYFLLFPQHLDTAVLTAPTLPGIPDVGIPAWALLLAITASAVIISPIVNSIAILGEEFGWRAYLQPKLRPLGERKMYVAVGVIWGVWHWPVIWMGFNYPGQPVLGSLAMVWFTFVIGTFWGWAVLRAGSVWPAVIGHGILNGMASVPLLLIAGEPNPTLGPTAVGVIGSAFFALAALIIMWKADDSVPVLVEVIVPQSSES